MKKQPKNTNCYRTETEVFQILAWIDDTNISEFKKLEPANGYQFELGDVVCINEASRLIIFTKDFKCKDSHYAFDDYTIVKLEHEDTLVMQQGDITFAHFYELKKQDVPFAKVIFKRANVGDIYVTENLEGMSLMSKEEFGTRYTVIT